MKPMRIVAGGMWLLATAAFADTTSTGADEEEPFHFAHRISPILAKQGCSAAECHGGGNGQGGFKLSLFAAVPQTDYQTITQELGSRRVDLAEPENSLLLKKPSRRMKHKGGRLLDEGDEDYQALLNWIAEGAPYVRGEPGELIGIDLEKTKGRVMVTAGFRRGDSVSTEDVTHLALLECTNSAVAAIDDDGTYHLNGPGEAWVLARYGKFSARVAIRQPFADRGATATGDPAHPLDRAWIARLRELGLNPAPRAPDTDVVRRLFIDLAGRPPTPYELKKFFALPAADRVSMTADMLLETPSFAAVFAAHVAEWFEIVDPSEGPSNAGPRNDALRRFFRASLESGEPLSGIARDILTEAIPQQAWKHFADPRDRAEYVGRSMLGIRIGCARCHDHPLDRWTNREHLEFAAYFSDARPAPGGGMMAGKLFVPGTSHEVKPALLPLGSSGDAPGGLPAEEELAWFILEGGKDQFARNMANRIFGALMGRHLVELPDDHRLSNPAIHEPMLELLAYRLTDGGFNLKSLVRFIVTSELYACSSAPSDPGGFSGDPALQYLARREARPLTPAQFKAAAESILGTAIDRPDPPDSPLARQLYVMNSGLIREGLETPGNQVDAIFDFETDAATQLKELFLLILSREPQEKENEALLPELRGVEDAKRAGRDLAFALLAGREFGSKR